MKHTYKANAISKPEYGLGANKDSMPTLIPDSDIEHYQNHGWMVIGAATITVDYLSAEEVSAKQLDALKAELQTVRAENQKLENAILDRINKLQALTYVEA